MTQKPQRAPEGVKPSEWKNRYLISAKLTSDQYANFMAYCRKHDYSVNSGLRSILNQFFS